MKKFLKVLGAATLIAGFAPYRVEKDEETGELKVKALLWQAAKKPGVNGEKDTITVKFCSFGKEEADEAHLFTDDLEVKYTGKPTAAPEEPEAPAEGAASEQTEPPTEPETPAEPEA